MSDSEEEHSDVDDDYESFEHRDNNGEHDEAAGREAWLAARVVAQLRTNAPSVSNHYLVIDRSVPDPIRVELAEALTQNTIVRGIMLQPHDYSKSSANAMAQCLMQSKSLLEVKLIGKPLTFPEYLNSISGLPNGVRPKGALCNFLGAISQSTSVMELSLTKLDLGPVSESFGNLLTRTKALRHLHVDLEGRVSLEEAATAAIASGFSKNTTLREIHLVNLQETSLTPVLTALQMHPLLEKLQVEVFSSFNGIDVMVGSKQSQIKELIFVGFIGSTVEAVTGFESFMLKMGRNTTILKLVIAGVPLSRDNIQQLKAMLRRNTVLQDLDLNGDALGSAGLAEIASALYRNTSIQGLDVSDNCLDDLAAANALRELLRRNKTITRLRMDKNAFGNNIAAVGCIADGFRANATLQVLNLSSCELNNQSLSIIAAGLGQQKRGLVDLNLSSNQITCSGLQTLVNNASAALSTVTCLQLSDNHLYDEGANFLAETLRRQTLPLKSLQLCHCDISDDGLVALMSALEENETLEIVELDDNFFTARGYLAVASSLPNIKGLRQIDFSLRWITSDPSVMSALLEGFRKNTSLHVVNIACGEHGTYWSQELSFLLYRNKFGRLLQDSDTDDRESLGLWSRALGSVAARPDVLFHVLTSKAGLIRATPGEDGEDSNKRKRDDSE
jgi:Ran GTPase-activating protein (RanGAP) involved in mRNA processing and transport